MTKITKCKIQIKYLFLYIPNKSRFERGQSIEIDDIICNLLKLIVQLRNMLIEYRLSHLFYVIHFTYKSII